MLTIPAKVIATCFSLVSFIAAIAVGIAAGNEAFTILWRAMIIMLVVWPLGRLIGGVAQRICDDSIQAHKDAFPVPREQWEIDAELEAEETAKEVEPVIEQETPWDHQGGTPTSDNVGAAGQAA